MVAYFTYIVTDGHCTGSDASQQRLTANNKTYEGMEEERIEDVPSDEVMIEETGMGVQVLEEQEEQHEVVEEVCRWANGQPQRTNSPLRNGQNGRLRPAS